MRLDVLPRNEAAQRQRQDHDHDQRADQVESRNGSGLVGEGHDGDG
ncbi:hypothetical protein SDC9_197295 [bioreactor metagenome]|uniref:Uncharacterized protein n=1 Tax=bioreactor metagenome TaxID=1076179 RepID=A0A645IQX7_9ZZZZ